MNNIQNVNFVPQCKVNFKADTNTQPQVVKKPMTQDELVLKMIAEQKKKEKQQKLKQNVSWGIGLAASALFAVFIGKQMFNEHKLSKATKNIANGIKEIKNPKLKQSAENEYAKGQLMSTKRVEDFIKLDKIQDVQPTKVDIEAAKKLMDNEIIGMQEVKDAFIDYLKEYNYNIEHGIKSTKPFVICLDGPAGTGKTTASEVLAKALNMHYKKISLAGANGKAPIKGYEAVYTGASCGGVAEGQLESGTRRVLYCLDEAEKTASSNHNGRVEDTLLSLFDDQAKFVDDNLGVDLDLSQSIFVLTTNEFEKLSNPLQNRVRKIVINKYEYDVKTEICKLKLKKALEANKMNTNPHIKISDDVCKAIAETTTDKGGRETSRKVDILIRQLKGLSMDNPNQDIIINKDYVMKHLSSAA